MRREARVLALRALLALLALLALASGGVPAAAAPRYELIRSGGEGVRLRVELEPADIRGALTAEGRRRYGVVLVVPPGREPELVETGHAGRSLAAGDPAPSRVEDLPRQAVRIDGTARMGGYRLVRLEVAPVTGGDSGIEVHEGLLAEVSFRGSDDAGTVRGAAGGGARERGAREVAASPRSVTARPDPEHADPVWPAVRSVALNAADAAAWREPAPEARPAGTAAAGWSCPGCVKVSVSADGLYAVDAGDLAVVPAFAQGDPREIHVYLRGQEIPVDVEGEADGRLDPGDRILFVGERNPGLYTDTTIYWIRPPDGARGLRMERRSALPSGWEALARSSVVKGALRLEEQNLIDLRLPDAEGKDPWMSALLVSREFASFALLPSAGPGFDLPDLTVAQAGGNYRLRAHLVGKTGSQVADDQHVELALNGRSIGVATWRISQEREKWLDLPLEPSWLKRAGNQVLLGQPPPADINLSRVNYADWVEIEYPRQLRARNGRIDFRDDPAGGKLYHVGGFSSGDVVIVLVGAGRPCRIEGARVLSLGPGMPVTVVFSGTGASSELRVLAAERGVVGRPDRIEVDVASSLRDGPGSPYLVIAHPRFLGEAERLASYRGGMAASLTDVYDEFSWGIEEPAAVRDLLVRAWEAWSIRPRYVALVGDSSFDPRNHKGFDDPSYRPASLLAAHWVYLDSIPDLRAPSDTWYAAVEGLDFLPDLAIGRIPARKPGELDAYRSKLEAYEAQAPSPWMERLQLFADDNLLGGECWVPGAIAADFDALAGRYLPAAAPGNLLRRYAGAYAQMPEFQNAIIQDLGQGVGVMVYAGHGNAALLAQHCAAPQLPILENRTLERIQNGPRLPLGTAMTCEAADVDYVAMSGGSLETRSIAEHYLLEPDRGMMGWLATSTALLYGTGMELVDHLFSVLYAGDPVGPPENRILGSIALGVELRHYALEGVAARDAVGTLMVLGDPAARLRATRP